MNNHSPITQINGEDTNCVNAFDRGLYYGHGLFETTRLSGGTIPLWPLHCKRLAAGASRLGIPCDERMLVEYRDALLARCPDEGIVKIVLTAGVGGAGYRPPASVSPNYLFQWFPFPKYSCDWSSTGTPLFLCNQKLAISPSLAGMKHLNRLEQVLARAEWGDEYPEGLLLDQQGLVVEGVSSNLFCFRDDQWFTPILADCGVAGVMREYLMSVLLPGLPVPVTESRITLEKLVSSEEVFLCNSVVGIWPVVSLAERYHWPLGEHVKSIQQRLKEVLPCYG
mgnify:FL=1